MDIFRLDVRKGVLMYGEINLLYRNIFFKGNTDDLVEPGFQIDGCFLIRYIFHVLEIRIYPVKRKGSYKLRIIGIKLISDWSTEKEPSVVELLELVRMHGILLGLPPENSIGDSDNGFSRYGGEQSAQQGVWNLKTLVLAE